MTWGSGALGIVQWLNVLKFSFCSYLWRLEAEAFRRHDLRTKGNRYGPENETEKSVKKLEFK